MAFAVAQRRVFYVGRLRRIEKSIAESFEPAVPAAFVTQVEETPKALIIRADNSLQKVLVMLGNIFIPQGICKAWHLLWQCPDSL